MREKKCQLTEYIGIALSDLVYQFGYLVLTSVHCKAFWSAYGIVIATAKIKRLTQMKQVGLVFKYKKIRSIFRRNTKEQMVMQFLQEAHDVERSSSLPTINCHIQVVITLIQNQVRKDNEKGGPCARFHAKRANAKRFFSLLSFSNALYQCNSIDFS